MGLIQAASLLVAFLGGLGVVFLGQGLRRRLASRAIPPQPEAPATRIVSSADETVPEVSPWGESSALLNGHGITLLARALREPLRLLRRSEGCPPQALRQLERVAWQARMLGSQRRPMKTKLVSPISLLQEAAEEVSQLRDGTVAATWSLRNRQPVRVDPERAGAAFREIMAAGAESCGKGGRLAIRVLPGDSNGHPVCIEVETGGACGDADPLAFLVAKHLMEGQGGRVEVDGSVMQIYLQGAASSPVEDVPA